MIDAAVLTPRASEAPLQAQEAADGASAPGPGVRLVDLSDYPTHTTVDRFEVEVSNLTATAAYQVIVSSDSAGLGIGACGTASQTETVTGVAAQTLTFFWCTSAPRPAARSRRRCAGPGPDSAEAAVSQRLTVLAVPEGAPGGTTGARAARAARGAVARVGTPGTVPSISFPTADRRPTSIKVTWGKPSNGGRALTGFGLLFWRTSDPGPAYSSALVKGAAAREHTYTGLQANTTYKFRIHACNGDNSCGWWTDPPREVTTPPEPTTAPTATAAPAGIPHAPHSLRYTDRLATSFTFHWRPHANTGGRPLTGFGILRWEKPGDRPSDSEATVVGAGSRSQPVTGLKYGREQRVRIRACNGTNRCSAWSSELTVPAMAGLLPTIALPKTSIEIGEQISVGANDVPVGAVAWLRFEGPIQPRGRCGASGTARAPAVPRDPSPSTGPGYYDSAWIEGCAPGGDAVIRLESQDGSVLYDKRTLRVVAASAPGQVGRPIVTPYNASLHVDWEPPTTGGTPTHYDLQYREGTSGDWTLVENITRTSYTITELTNGTSYQVQVRAANATRDGAWSETVTGTPSAAAGEPPSTTPITIDPSTPTCDPIPDPPATSPSTLVVPANLDVTPVFPRHAQLAWAPVPGAAKYEIQIRRRTGSSWGGWGPPDRNVATSGDVTDRTCYNFDLDRIVKTRTDSHRGLGHDAAFGFQIRAIHGDTASDFSSEVIVVDISRAYANADSRGYPVADQGQAVVNWQRVDQILGSDFQSGQYSFRYREVRGIDDTRIDDAGETIPHTDLEWEPNDPALPLGTTTDNPITGLALDTIYGIQIRLDNTGSDGTTSVYAVRDIYAWPHNQSALGRTVVAHPLSNEPIHKQRSNDQIVYRYRICTDTFTFPAHQKNGLTYKAGDPAQWAPYINHALLQWQYATNGLVQMIHEVDANGESLPCSDPLDFLTEVAVEYNRAKGLDQTPDQIEGLIRDLLQRLNEEGIKGRLLGDVLATDLKLNEVLMVDNLIGPTKALSQRVLKQISSDVGIPRCSAGCALTNTVTDRHGNTIRTADIYLRRIGNWAPSFEFMDLRRVTQMRFNTCPNAGDGEYYNRPYSTLVHEAGHVLGLSHPTNLEAIMSYTIGVPKCSPHPLDVLALMALYQSRGDRNA